MNQITQQQAHKIWLTAAEKVKDRVIAPTLYRALELPVGIAVEGNEFILGFANQDIPMAGHLRSAQHRAIIDQCVSEVLNRKVRVRIIEGTTTDDYENYKRQQKAREATHVTVSAQREKERQIIAAWDQVGEQITRLYAKLQLRQLAQQRAEFMWESFRIINESVDKMGYNEESTEIEKRALARVFEKFATVVDIPSTMLAFEFFRLRKEGKL
ncbi:MAG: hypothetical protein GX139_13045 [Armatimonadetes bacterium]|jgi:hypothetical protein|nr:hypothetical protein [Armatimonadota bacterium]